MTGKQLEDIAKQLVSFGVRDTEFPEAEMIKTEDTLAIVQDGVNKRISVATFMRFSVENPAGLNETLDDILSRLIDVENKVADALADMDKVLEIVNNCQSTTNELLTKYDSLETRVTNVETKVTEFTDQSTAIENINNTIANISGDLTHTTIRVEDAEKGLAELKITADSITSTVIANRQESDGKFTDVYSQITQLADKIESKVQQTDYEKDLEDLAARVTLTESTITQMSDSIDLRVTRTEYNDAIDDVNDSIRVNSSNITILTDQISSKVSQIDFSSYQGTIDERFSAITQDISSVRTEVSKLSGNTDSSAESLRDYVDSVVSELQGQIDGSIETWFYPYSPVGESGELLTDVEPYASWLAEDTASGSESVRDMHLGDIFYDTSSGYAYRFICSGESGSKTYGWVIINDSAVVEALALASQAQDTADSKRRIFIQTPPDHPVPPYDEGDLWAQGTLTGQDGMILRCIRSKGMGEVYSADDWGPAYDLATVKELKSTFEVLADAISGTVAEYNGDGLLTGETYSKIYQSINNINLSVDNINDGLLATGIDITDKKVTITADNFRIQNNNGTTALTIVNDPVTGLPLLSVSNLYIQDLFVADSWTEQMVKEFNDFRTSIGVADGETVGSIAEGKASSALAYFQQNVIGGIIDDRVSDMATNIDNLGRYYEDLSTSISDIGYLKSALLDGQTVVGGGLILTSLIQLGSNEGDDKNPAYTIRSGINGQYVANALGGGIAAWFGGSMLDKQLTENADNESAAASLFRMDGSGYLAGGALSWGPSGSLYIDENVIIGEEGSNRMLADVLKMLVDFRSWFELEDITYEGVARKVLKVRGTGDGTDIVGFYVNGFVSSKGLDTTASSGVVTSSSTGSGISESDVWTILGGSTSNKVISEAYLPSSVVTSDDLSSYATTVWVNSNYSPVSHTHTSSDITDLTSVITEIVESHITGTGETVAGMTESEMWAALAASSSNVIHASHIPDLSNTYAEVSHTHTASDISNLETWISGKGYITSHQTLRTLTVKGNGTAIGTYTPSSASTINITPSSIGAAESSHSHAISDVTNLQSILKGKASASHTHAISEVTGLQSALDGKQAAGNYVTTDTEQTISETKTFSKNLSVTGLLGVGIVPQTGYALYVSGGSYFDGIITAVGDVNVSGDLSVQSNVNVTGTITSETGISSNGYVSAKGIDSTSDIRLKEDVSDYGLAVEKVADAPLVGFRWKDSGEHSVGSIAQYWQDVVPELVREVDGYLRMDYGSIALVSSIAAARRIVELEERINNLEQQIRS